MLRGIRLFTSPPRWFTITRFQFCGTLVIPPQVFVVSIYSNGHTTWKTRHHLRASCAVATPWALGTGFEETKILRLQQRITTALRVMGQHSCVSKCFGIIFALTERTVFYHWWACSARRFILPLLPRECTSPGLERSRKYHLIFAALSSRNPTDARQQTASCWEVSMCGDNPIPSCRADHSFHLSCVLRINSLFCGYLSFWWTSFLVVSTESNQNLAVSLFVFIKTYSGQKCAWIN